MTKKKELIFTADGLGIKKSYNDAILDCFLNGFLTSTSICPNMQGYHDAIERVLPQCVRQNGEKIDLGINLNVVDGGSLRLHNHLANYESEFHNSFLSLFYHSYNADFLWELEDEFRAQIELVLRDSKKAGFDVSFISSNSHIHAIPKIFKLVKKLAEEYKIPFIRTQNEILYTTDKASPRVINIIKVFVLRFLTLFFNKANITNKHIIGIGFSGEMGNSEIYYGIKRLSKENGGLAEILIKPDINKNNSEKYEQYLSAKDFDLKKKIEDLGFVFTTILDFNQRNCIE